MVSNLWLVNMIISWGIHIYQQEVRKAANVLLSGLGMNYSVAERKEIPKIFKTYGLYFQRQTSSQCLLLYFCYTKYIEIYFLETRMQQECNTIPIWPIQHLSCYIIIWQQYVFLIFFSHPVYQK